MACNCDQCGGKLTGLAHIGIHIKDMARSKAFYVDTLGLELTDEANNNGTKLALVQVGSLILELIELPNQAPRAAGVIDHIAIAVEEIEPLVCKLVEKQVPFKTDAIGSLPHLFGGIKNIFLTGPDGELLEFFEYMNK